MKILDPGHLYELTFLDGGATHVSAMSMEGQLETANNWLQFVKREGPGYPGNVGHHPGTNLQEVLRALIDRVKYLDAQIQHDRNTFLLQHLRAAIFQLELRAAERHGRQFKFGIDELNHIEELPTCSQCGHIGCEGSCHS